MTDPYSPPLTNFVYTEDEEGAIALALKRAKPWQTKVTIQVTTNGKTTKQTEKYPKIKAIKDRLLDFHMERHNDTCCYCRINLRGTGSFIPDREHILPKGDDDFKHLTFDVANLSVACKRCNMQYKGTDTSFVVDRETILEHIGESSRYKFVHPNLDKWEDHLRVISTKVNRVALVKYTVRNDSEKGRYTSDYFDFASFEVQQLDSAQGLEHADPEALDLVRRAAGALGLPVP